MKGENIHIAVNLVCGFMLGAGVGFGGMARQSSTLAFFAAPLHFIFDEIHVSFSPALGVVFATALTVHTFLYYFIQGSLKRSLIGKPLYLGTCNPIDFKLLLGAILFGFGWALGGYCPGPSIVASVTNAGASLFAIFMILGFYICKKMSTQNSKAKSTILQPEVATLLLLALPLYFFLFGNITLRSFLDSDLFVFPQTSLPFGITLTQIFGGFWIGLAIAVYFIVDGGTLGISGRISGTVISSEMTDFLGRIAFFGGLILSGVFLSTYFPSTFTEIYPPRPTALYVLGGLLVGIGTSLSNGCTSGHGICGLSRVSVRSIAATALFMASNSALTAFLLLNHVY